MRKFGNELNYLDLIIVLGSNDLDISFIFQNEIYIKHLQNSVISREKNFITL